MGSSLSTLLNASRKTICNALQRIPHTPSIVSLLNPQNTWSPPPSIAQPLSRERQLKRVDILAAEASPSIDLEARRVELFRYISHTGERKRIRIGVDVRLFENRLMPVPGYVNDRLSAPTISGIITGISSMTTNLVTLTIRDVDLKTTFHLITPRRAVFITKRTIRTYNLLRSLGLKRRLAYTEEDIFNAFWKIEVPYKHRVVIPVKPMTERQVRFLEPRLPGMLTNPMPKSWHLTRLSDLELAPTEQ